MYMNVTEFKESTNRAIGNKVRPSTISPTDVSEQINKLADLTAEAINNISIGVGNAQIGVEPKDNVTIYNVSEAGEYPLYGGLIVTPEELQGNLIQFRKINSVWTKFSIAVPTIGAPTSSDVTFIIL